MKNNLFALAIFLVSLMGCEQDNEPELPPEIVSSFISSDRVAYNEDITLNISLEDPNRDYSVTWYIINLDGDKVEIGSGRFILYEAPSIAGDYDISVTVEVGSQSITEETATLVVYGLVEERFTSPSGDWGVVNNARITTSDKGAQISLSEGEAYAGLATTVSNFSNGLTIIPPFEVNATFTLDRVFEVGEYVELRLRWSQPDTNDYFSYVAIVLFPSGLSSGEIWIPRLRSYSVKTGDYQDANSSYTFLEDQNLDVVTSDVGDLNNVEIAVDEYQTIVGHVNGTKLFEVAIEEIVLEPEEVSWELDAIYLVTQSTITLNSVILK